jgi:hypothetical protein
MNRKSLITLSFVIAQLSLTPASAQKISIAKSTIDCGRTGYMMPITAEFEIKNKGLRHLTITDVKTDCGCTKAELPKKSLGPGEKFILKLTYDARMLGHFDKQAAIYSNASKKPVYVRMRGAVLADFEDYSGTYPYTMGELLTDIDQIEFDDVNKGENPSQVINILNNSTHRMRPNVLHLPPYLTALATPETLEAGRAGKIVLTLNSEKIHDLGLTQTSVYLAGDLGEKVQAENEMPISIVLLPNLKTFEGEGLKSAPKMRLSADHIDVGMVNGKMEKNGTITITNTGLSALEISSLQMFTSGLKLTLGKQSLLPGEQTKLKIVAAPQRLKKARQKPRVLMITNDPEHAKVVIHINVK